MPATAPDPSWPDTLRRARPDLSAAEPLWAWQRGALYLLLSLAAAGLWIETHTTVTVFLALLSPIFLCVVVIRAAALWHFARCGTVSAAKGPPQAFAPDAGLPIYSILVPLFEETEVVADLVAALDRLNWPKDRLDILFVTEACDDETRRALVAAVGDRDMRIVVVPEGTPRTKPRALMYALGNARGEYVVVYDAEDEPAPDQLRLAYARLSAPGSRTGCVQAQLNVYNVDDSFFSRQFTIEYTALFDAILPALPALRLPVLLGGTSNHFRREVLEAAGGWDPYNVTEDADLGIRLARAGWQVEVLPSTTWEEAPACFGVWIGQRTRWLKGWMQTCLVHLRRPAVLRRELGTRAFLGFNILMGGLIVSALIHPIFYAVAAWSLWTGSGHLAMPEEGGWRAAVWGLGVANLLLAYGLGMALAWVATRRRHGTGLAWRAVFIPVYWLLISLAAYRALFELVRAPYYWEKTAHNGRRRSG